eukprot:scaffold233993_cov28-Tisochrysis_lutea.AAC.1
MKRADRGRAVQQWAGQRTVSSSAGFGFSLSKRRLEGGLEEALVRCAGVGLALHPECAVPAALAAAASAASRLPTGRRLLRIASRNFLRRTFLSVRVILLC